MIKPEQQQLPKSVIFYKTEPLWTKSTIGSYDNKIL
jgi:hypothetical protein